uniref:Uncharacterized protein n=1 Tax=Siphoviridae sp. ctg8V11 TaxID=2827910 RepID=A0A8S5T3M1_9CAUD|nr:MAG TPA: hypothetical protein [Siphoviridae sp. ctg8V11]
MGYSVIVASTRRTASAVDSAVRGFLNASLNSAGDGLLSNCCFYPPHGVGGGFRGQGLLKCLIKFRPCPCGFKSGKSIQYSSAFEPFGQGKISRCQLSPIESALPKVSAGHFLPGCAGAAFRFPDGESCKNPGANAPGFLHGDPYGNRTQHIIP